MDMDNLIDDIRKRLKAGGYVNESSVSQGVLLPVLQALGWPVFDTQTVWPEYTVQGKRVDFALCHPKERPVVFVEVKQVGQSEGADRQLFEYAFHEGVPMAVLTDGQCWHFYLPAEAGHYEERRVYMLDLLARDKDECIKRLKRYISYNNIRTGEYLKNARADHADIAHSRLIKETLPVALEKLIREGDELLIELISDKVESLCGYKPEPDLVESFLAKQQIKPAIDGKVAEEIYGRPSQGGTSAPGIRDCDFTLKGKKTECRNAKDVLIKIFEDLSRNDRTFLDRFVALPKHGAKRRYVARNREDLYPGRPDICKNASYQLESGFWVGTNYSKNAMRRILITACDVARLKFGSDLIVNLGD